MIISNDKQKAIKSLNKNIYVYLGRGEVKNNTHTCIVCLTVVFVGFLREFYAL